MVLLWIIGSTLFVSAISLIGIFTLLLKEKTVENIILFLVSLSAGALMGGAFIHLIPESVEVGGSEVFLYVLIGFIMFFFVEKVLHWRHCHKERCPIHTFAYINLVGDGVHNFIDGLIMAAAFLTDIHLGIITTLLVTLHEIPQEIGDFGVLVYGGFSRVRALMMNFISAITAVLGGIIGFLLYGYVESLTLFLLPFAAGGFIYISASDLIPEIRKDTGLRNSMINFTIFLLGILLMLLIKG